MENASIREDIHEENGKTNDTPINNIPNILQETVLEFQFDKNLPSMKARELALDWEHEAFGTKADEDITGVSIWSASLILSRWIIDHAEAFADKQVCELGAGCGVSGIAAHLYTKASRVVLSDLFDHTIRNLAHNVELNKAHCLAMEPEQEKSSAQCAQCGALQKFSSDNPDGKLMMCSACRSVEYCSRECQKKGWKMHKLDCKKIQAQRERTDIERTIEVQAIDWANRETWPKHNSQFDIVLGSDLVYHSEIVAVLVSVVDGLLSPNGKFIHIASQSRDSLVEFKEAMQARNFVCDIQIIPDSYKQNPLVGKDSVKELFDLHFGEMSDIYCIYQFSRK